MSDKRPLDRSPYYVSHFEHLDRILSRPQLAGIGISGCVGAGIFVTSSSLISTTGSLGAAISYVIAGGISACVLYSMTEMVSARPLTGSLIDLPHNFLDPAFGFAVAASYSLANICSMATLTAQSAELTALLKTDPVRHSTGIEVGINVSLIALTTFSHCLGVRLYGKIERVRQKLAMDIPTRTEDQQVVMWFKLSLFVLVCVMAVVINAGGGGPRQTSFRSNYTSHAFPPGWKPIGFDSTNEPRLFSTGVSDTQFGVAGPGGRLFAFLTAVSLAMFSCMGGEMVAMTAGEAKEPWRDIPISMSFVYVIPLSLYPFVMMAGGANVNYADPHLYKMWARGTGDLSLSPFVIAAQSSSLHALPRVLNVFFIISAYTAANTAIYVASRSVFMLAQTYLSRKLADTFGRTNNGHTPLAAIALCSVLGFLSLAGLSKNAHSQPRITLSEFYTGSVACVYICLCVTFLNFKAGLDRLDKRKILSRDDRLYIKKLFKSRWQPLPAYIGIVGCVFVIIWSGIPPIYILAARGSLTSTDNLKQTVSLTFDVFGAYIGPLLFAGFYLTYKYIHPLSVRVDVRDLRPSDYVLDDLAAMEGENPRLYSRKSSDSSASQHGPPPIELDVLGRDRRQSSIMREDIGRPRQSSHAAETEELDPEIVLALEAEDARREQREHVLDVLRRRPPRMERGFWREVWSFVVVEKVPAVAPGQAG
ncbi:amino acid permease-domain-containing protein [Massariosphaeria phaeospora]|uniref:Amino acid permease-domain-containing protein n=1 Tax=Massariosphaeria phaeospora TaxID=100035 RepID=A0A7C8IDD3_9PLEO|nr:amino acid permease-domain-containing protein [Massariosphaeria phaeospora]